MKKIILVISIILLIGITHPICNGNYNPYVVFIIEDEPIMIENFVHYDEMAGRIVDYYGSTGKIVSWDKTRRIIKSAHKMTKEIFPNKEIKLIDVLALIMVESHFNPNAKGRHKEVGLMQIKDWRVWLKEINNVHDPYNIDCNINMGLRILKDKMRYHKNKKKSIIAYNGLVYKKGKLSEKYWNRFIKYRNILKNYCNFKEVELIF